MESQVLFEHIVEKRWLQNASKRAGIEISFPSTPPSSETELGYFEYFLRTLELTQAATERVDLGLLLGKNIRIEELAGNHGYILVNAAETLRDFVEMAQNYSQYNSQTVGVAVQAKGQTRTRMTVLKNINISPRQTIFTELLLSCATGFFRTYHGSGWLPVKVGFCHSAPGDLTNYQRFWSDRVAFDQKNNFIEFDNSCLDFAINDVDPMLVEVIRNYADNLVGFSSGKGSLRDQIHILLTENIGSKATSLSDLALQLKLSRSTLQRRLSEEGYSFRDIRNEVIELLAKQMLSTTDAPISKIMEKLGFSEASAFTRAFSNLTGGISPREFRKKAREESL